MTARRALAAAAGAAVLTLPLYASPFALALALTCLLYVGLAVSWSLFSGPTRYLSLATSAFFGLGAYGTAVGLGTLPWPLLILAGALVAAALAWLIGLLTLRLRGAYFAVLTFGLSEVVRHAVTYVEKSVSGTVGRVLTDAPEVPTIYWTVAAIAGAALVTFRLVQRSDLGVALRAVGEDEERAATLGVDPRRVKTVAFCLSAAFAGAAGAAMAPRSTYIDPSSVFNPFILFQTVLIAMVGGPSKLHGPVIAALGFSLLAEALRLNLPYLYLIALGLLLILSVLFLPAGLAGVSWLNRWFEPRPPRMQPDAPRR
ncbi:MAG TPA: branched-chain amino acid ABC transporter permease [Polyangia bacterium]|jgi:branched-chain amino acid transport system permease protein|nr:branched-chain amino acid ABC transporter permease [Polyangia bacterium]